MQFYFDTEFTGLQKNTDLISIGIISDNGDFFYAELTDYDKSKCNDWIRENVIENLLLGDISKTCKFDSSCRNMIVKGNKTEVREMLIRWLKLQSPIPVWQFISDVSHYDFVLLIDLLSNGKTIFDCPDELSPVCIDINSFISRYFNISERKAFDANRERVYNILLKKEYPELFEKFSHMEELDTRKHNALFDALVIIEINKIIGTGFGPVNILSKQFQMMLDKIEELKKS